MSNVGRHSPFRPTGPVVITGARGQLGSHLATLLGNAALPVDVDTLDLTDRTAVLAKLNDWRPVAIINCAAYTAVDAAEAPENRAICHAVNHHAVETLATAANSLDAQLVQISTDYVFCNSPRLERAFREDDPIAPAGVYALSKAAGEQAALKCSRSVVVRTCGLYGSPATPDAKNFVNAMLGLSKTRNELRVVDDQICCPTWVVELSDAILHLLAVDAQGIYHVTNREGLAWKETAETIFAVAGVNCQVNSISTAEYGAAAPRPAYSELDTSKYHALAGPPMSTCRDAVGKWLSMSGNTAAARDPE
ncbi:MAG: dTDP-4-dehydrorhamnose reductase [Planctomycetales bacterium]|nr:dTDP-4-dehydrorhamnose reductase [Planctomycetales bacterium]